ncbi:MAG TPA: peptidoglycan editing factor PgeF [Rhizomicrobium sp.]|nr:peptidoglycan editing factor PgeF [Rhizomicrobium sp.]
MGPPFHLAANLARLSGIAHGFFGRDGGISEGLYATLNCGPGSKDDPARVAENRARVMAALAPAPQETGSRLITLSQIHSPKVHVVSAGWDAARHPEGDGMACALPGLALGIQTADCAPVLFADAKTGVIGAAHAGWKGALNGVLEATITAMVDLGARRDAIAAAIGPAIAQDHYEVGPEFRANFLAQDPGHAEFFIADSGRFRFDLPAYAALRLARAGIGGVAHLGLCTYPPENGFFSFRRTTHRGEPDYGRQISVIMLTE